MRRKICIFFIIVLLSINYTFNSVNAVEITGKKANKIKLYEIQSTTFLAFNLLESNILKSLKTNFGYTGELAEPIIIETTATITKINKKSIPDEYIVKLGNKEYVTTKSGITKIYGYDKSWGEEIKVGTSWRVTLEADEVPDDYTMTWSNQYRYEIQVSKLTSYKEINEAPDTSDKTQEEVDLNEHKSPTSTVVDAYNAVKSYSEFMKKFGADQAGEISKGIANFFRDRADGVQALLNKAQTVFDGIPFSADSLVYNYSDLIAKGNNYINTSKLENEVDYSILNKYTKVNNSDSTLGNNQKYIINIDNKVDKFSSKTKIPVIPIDIYGFAFEKFDILDVDFLQIYHKGNKSSFWNKIRKIFSTITHIILFISVVVLLSTLIYHGINIIKGANDNPGNRGAHIQGLYRFMSSLIILIFVVLFMALCTTGSNFLIELIRGKNIAQDDELPIRVNVDNLYSFSTNVTGYFRFMTESEDSSTRNAYTVYYVVIVIINCVVFFLMIFRSILMWVFGMIGPIIASKNALNVQEQVGFKLTIKDWAKIYALLAGVQIVITTIYSIIEYAMI